MTAASGLYKKWVENLNRSLDSFRQQAAASGLPVSTRNDGGTSVVLLPAEEAGGVPERVVLIQWREPEKLTGHVVDVDANGLLIAVVHVGEKRWPRSFPGARVLVPRTGVTYSRARRTGHGAQRHELPVQWQWLMRVWKTYLSRDAEAQVMRAAAEDPALQSQGLLTKCEVCKRTHHLVDEELREHAEDLCLTCPCCMVASHRSCCAAVLVTELSRMTQIGPAPRTEATSSNAGQLAGPPRTVLLPDTAEGVAVEPAIMQLLGLGRVGVNDTWVCVTIRK